MAVSARLVIVSGAPASGKTTLAERLAAALRYPILTKDSIKEALFDTLGSIDRDHSRQLSFASYLVLKRIAGRLIDAGTSLVLESNFQRGVSENDLLPLARRSRAVLIHCQAPPLVLVRRYNERAAGSVRHPGHHDAYLTPEDLQKLGSGIYDPVDLPIPTLRVETTDQYEPEFAAILEFARTGE